MRILRDAVRTSLSNVGCVWACMQPCIVFVPGLANRTRLVRMYALPAVYHCIEYGADGVLHVVVLNADAFHR